MAWITVLGIPAAVYVMSITALMFVANDQQQRPFLLLGAGLLTAGIYIFHRCSILAVEPMQERHRIAIRNKKPLLLISGVLIFIALVVFEIYEPIFSLLVFASILGVVAYGRRTITKPLRTYIFVKPVAVGIAIVMFAWVLNGMSNSVVVVVWFTMLSSADALVCDSADCEYDAASGCQTLAMKLGEQWTWICATAVYTVASFGIYVATSHSSFLGVFFYIVFVASIPFRKIDSRYVVDFRLVLVLLLAWGEWMLWSGQLQ